MTTYTAHVRAHPDCIAQTPEDTAVEAALAMEWTLCGDIWYTPQAADGTVETIHQDDYSPYTDPAQAAELAEFTVQDTGARFVMERFPEGRLDVSLFRLDRDGPGPVVVELGIVTGSLTQPHATTDACLLALRAWHGMEG